MTYLASLRYVLSGWLVLLSVAVACSSGTLPSGQQIGGNGGGGGVSGSGDLVGGSGGGAAGGGAGAGGYGATGQSAGGRAGAAFDPNTCYGAPPGSCLYGIRICDHDTPGQCGTANPPGHCIDAPAACTQEYAPVCGCDGKTYGNDCMRQVARMQLDYAGACSPRDSNCGYATICDETQTYCFGSYGSGIGCRTLPVECASAPTCDCVCAAGTPMCSSLCTCTETGGIVTVFCKTI